MTFIFSDKNDLLGRLLYKIVKYSIESKYVDKIICFSSAEPSYYAKKFSIPINKFEYVGLGEDVEDAGDDEPTFFEKKDLISMGLSNRDNDFLIETFRDSGYTLDIYTDKDFRIGSNITGYGDIVNNRITKILYKYKVLLISLVKPDISSGQLTAIHALKYGIPIVADDANGM